MLRTRPQISCRIGLGRSCRSRPGCAQAGGTDYQGNRIEVQLACRRPRRTRQSPLSSANVKLDDDVGLPFELYVLAMRNQGRDEVVSRSLAAKVSGGFVA